MDLPLAKPDPGVIRTEPYAAARAALLLISRTTAHIRITAIGLLLTVPYLSAGCAAVQTSLAFPAVETMPAQSRPVSTPEEKGMELAGFRPAGGSHRSFQTA
jgi:hypothetical protein